MELKDYKGNIGLVGMPKLISRVSKNGSRQRGEKNVFKMLRALKKKNKGVRPIEVLGVGLNQSMPYFSLLKKKVGGTYYRIPVYLEEKKGINLAVRWVIEEYKINLGKKTLEGVVYECYLNEGNVIKRREERHVQGINQRAFLKFLD